MLHWIESSLRQIANTSEGFKDDSHPVACILAGRYLFPGLMLVKSLSDFLGGSKLYCSVWPLQVCMSHTLTVPSCDSMVFCIQQSLQPSLRHNIFSCSHKDETTFTPCKGFPAKPPFLKDASPTTNQRHHPPQRLTQGLSLPSALAGQTPAQNCPGHHNVNALLVLQNMGLRSRSEKKMMPLITGASVWLQDPEFRVAVTELILLCITVVSWTLYQCHDKELV